MLRKYLFLLGAPYVISKAYKSLDPTLGGIEVEEQEEYGNNHSLTGSDFDEEFDLSDSNMESNTEIKIGNTGKAYQNFDDYMYFNNHQDQVQDPDPWKNLPSITVNTYPNHLWLIKSKNTSKNLALFWLNDSRCKNFWLEFQKNNYVSYGSENCSWDYSFFDLAIGDWEITNVMDKGRTRTWSGYARRDDMVDVKFINNSGEELEVFWLDHRGVLFDYSGSIND